LSYSKVDFGEALMPRFVSLLNQKLSELQQRHLNLWQSVFGDSRTNSVTNVGLLQRLQLQSDSHLQENTGPKKKAARRRLFDAKKTARGQPQNGLERVFHANCQEHRGIITHNSVLFRAGVETTVQRRTLGHGVSGSQTDGLTRLHRQKRRCRWNLAIPPEIASVLKRSSSQHRVPSQWSSALPVGKTLP
jgi:hypothetical protein